MIYEFLFSQNIYAKTLATRDIKLLPQIYHTRTL